MHLFRSVLRPAHPADLAACASAARGQRGHAGRTLHRKSRWPRLETAPKAGLTMHTSAETHPAGALRTVLLYWPVKLACRVRPLLWAHRLGTTACYKQE